MKTVEVRTVAVIYSDEESDSDSDSDGDDMDTDWTAFTERSISIVYNMHFVLLMSNIAIHAQTLPSGVVRILLDAVGI